MATEMATAAVGSVSAFSKLYVITFLALLVWFIITLLIMLVMTHKGGKKGQIVMIFIISTILLLVAVLIGYFNTGAIMTLVGA